MASFSRRSVLASAPLGAALPLSALQSGPAQCLQESVSLDGEWIFEASGKPPVVVQVPHTWQTMTGYEQHRGIAVYRKRFDAPTRWSAGVVRIEFEAVFHTARVKVNGQRAGEHTGLGYTAFEFDITRLVKFGSMNELEVEVDNAFFDRMLPRGNSSDWAHDGGIYRPVHLHITPANYIERVAIDAIPELATRKARVQVETTLKGQGTISAEIRDLTTSTVVVRQEKLASTGAALEISNARLWHFDAPHLYELTLTLMSGAGVHTLRQTFGVRSFEVRDRGLWLNGERMRVAGVERMAGSNPEFGMAEPTWWIEHDHRDMKELNCMFTRVHWQQDRRVLDFCDREGIMVQLEVPTWGPKTFDGMKDPARPDDDLMANGLAHFREQLARDRNHPCVVMWGVCNEIGGQRPADGKFAETLYNEARRVDPRRPRTYASNSMGKTPDKDISRIMGVVEVNEYVESWMGGALPDLVKLMDGIRDAFPQKPVIVAEYGYCACRPEWPEGDVKRRRVLATHTEIFRKRPEIAGLIFFCYNDYRTHIGDRGVNRLQQRVHGVVDVYGNRKPSFEDLRRELSPVESITVRFDQGNLALTVKTRDTIPSYTLHDYCLRVLVHGQGGTVMERLERPVAEHLPGAVKTYSISAAAKSPTAITVDLLRPNGWSVWTEKWEH